MAISKDDILEAVSAMSVMDLNDLVKAFEEKFGVSAAAMSAGPAAGPAAAPWLPSWLMSPQSACQPQSLSCHQGGHCHPPCPCGCKISGNSKGRHSPTQHKAQHA